MYVAAGRQARNRVSEGSGPPVLIDPHRRRIGAGLGQVDGGRDRAVVPAAAEVFVGNKGVIAAASIALRRTAGGDGHDLRAGCRLPAW